MAHTGVLLRIGCHDGQVVVTNDRVYLRGTNQTSDEVWSVPRARVAGVQTHAGLILAELAVRTSDGQAYNAAGVGASDALLAIDLLGYAPERNGGAPDTSPESRELELVCGDARLSVTDTTVEWTGERPWTLLRKEIAGVSARLLSPFVDLSVHTHSGRLCRATNVPVYGAIRVVELLGYIGGSCAGNGTSSHREPAIDQTKARRISGSPRGNLKDTRAIRRAVRSPSSRASRSGASVARSRVAGDRRPRGLGRLAALFHFRRRR